MLPRIEFDELEPGIKQVLAPRVKRLGYFGEYFQVVARLPRALELSLALIDELKSQVDQRLVEIIALTQAVFYDNEYERIQHERLCANLHYERSWISEVLDCQPDASERLTDVEKAVQRLALSMLLSGGRQAEAELDVCVILFEPAIVIAILLLIGKYAGDSMVMNVNQLVAPTTSIFAEINS